MIHLMKLKLQSRKHQIKLGLYIFNEKNSHYHWEKSNDQIKIIEKSDKDTSDDQENPSPFSRFVTPTYVKAKSKNNEDIYIKARQVHKEKFIIQSEEEPDEEQDEYYSDSSDK